MIGRFIMAIRKRAIRLLAGKSISVVANCAVAGSIVTHRSYAYLLNSDFYGPDFGAAVWVLDGRHAAAMKAQGIVADILGKASSADGLKS